MLIGIDEKLGLLSEAREKLITTAEYKIKERIEKICDALHIKVKEKIISDARIRSRLKNYDEELYRCFEMLMQSYRDACDCCVQSSQNEILDGIHTVLVSRLKQFEEICLFDSDNPIKAEKDTILRLAEERFELITENYVSLLSDRTFDVKKETIKQLCEQMFTEWFDMSPFVNPVNLWSEINTFCLNDYYVLYTDGLRFCFNCLNNMEMRTAAHTYIDLAEKELDILESIIKVQTTVLESNSDGDEQIVYQVLSLLHEGHKFFSKALFDVKSIFSDANDIETAEPFESFTESLAHLFQDDIFFTAAPFETERFIFLFKEISRHFFEPVKRASQKDLYNFQRAFNDESVLANDIKNGFVKLCEQWPDFDPLQESYPEHCQILNGIRETIGIKTESLNENINHFSEQSKSIIITLKAKIKTLSEDDGFDSYGILLEKWIVHSFGENFNAGDFFRSECADADLFGSYRQHNEKLRQEFTEKANKLMFAFKKETLLYEISTYEEILVYSVSRLRGTDEELIKNVIFMLDELMTLFETVLKKNNYTLIKPVPHEIFNGKEHEVLMAEPHEGFTKGEIIKTVNTGYRHKDTVILRANVIAAK